MALIPVAPDSKAQLDAVDPAKQPGQAPAARAASPDPAPPYERQHQRHESQLEHEADKSPGAGPGASTVGQRWHRFSSSAGWPLNKAANLVGAEGWWPTSMEKECNKAARILHSFTSLDAPTPPRTNGPLHPTGLTRNSMVKIPASVLARCSGLAIFNVLRAGACHGSLAAGSGVVVARRPDGTWSPPSSFVISTLGAGFVFGLDIYDCVCVLNTPAQVAAFTNPRVSLGAEGSIAIGPVGTGGHVEAAVSRTARPMWSYMKSRGIWAGVQIDGTIVVSRADANAVFYGERGITARKILGGDVAWPMGAKPLFDVLQALEGRAGLDRGSMKEAPTDATPGFAPYRDDDGVSTKLGEQDMGSDKKVDSDDKDGAKETTAEVLPPYKDDEEYEVINEKESRPGQ